MQIPSHVLFTDHYSQKKGISYNGHSKSALFTQWSKSIQKQYYEEACYWTAELDASGWHNEIWQKLIVLCSKHVHLHCPKLPLLFARNYAYYQLYQIKCMKHTNYEYQPRNNIQLRQNLCQIIGLVTLSSKGPIYNLPDVDLQKINENEMLLDTHTWLIPHVDSKDHKMIVHIMSTLFRFVQSKSMHKVLYWFSVLIEYDKYCKKNKISIEMKARKPLLPDEDSYRHVNLENSSGKDWIWLVWHIIGHACVEHHIPQEGIRTIKALGYLFACNYTSVKRLSRISIVIHALLLICHPMDWIKSVYSQQSEHMIEKACANISLLYKDIHKKK